MKNKFLKFLEENKDKKFVITAHRGVDPDAVSSAFSIHSVLPNSVIAFYDNPKEDTIPLIEALGFEYLMLKDLNREDYDGLIVVDCSTYLLNKDAEGWDIKLIIDHHHLEGKSMHAELELIDPESPSACELIYRIIPSISEKTALALSAGIISDTARFKSAKGSTFKILEDTISKSGKEYPEILKVAYPADSRGTKIAVLKALQRLRYEEYKGYMLVVSEVGARESRASSLISDIADVVFVASQEPDGTKVSARVGDHADIPANEIMKEVGTRFGGDGGGHPKASGCLTHTDAKNTLDYCIEITKK
ncbi:DHH family phosphoesterase, partial [Candidatus Micrarchaeota archaeon]|nr:DHH family phosphoesterase [Candidatus Micrarchaeota archaeon]